ncbi:MAG: radical SAM protein [Acidobacteria bacterium]|jgi:radical SAM superfamily enzyme YgiQ (UPF0313 family)|nr:radical SAM protein [Acidobacteriota bacterium]MDP7690784.1 CUAEP/CCAEP-tail radical SAM protein [Vicinamibacterales bacterium]
MRVTLVATYELGRQPFGLASPAAWLREAGIHVTTIDLSREPFRPAAFDTDLVAFHLPMHTATRLAVPVIRRVQALYPTATLCCYGLYAQLNEPVLRDLGVEHVLGGEFEQALVEVATADGGVAAGRSAHGDLPRLRFRVPERRGLPSLARYASLRTATGDCRVVGYTEASRGCKHRCRHCPVVPVYEGRFRAVPRDVVLADVRAQVEAGARHITFGDPDFFNGIGHAVAIVEACASEFPGLSYDVTIKVEHLRRHDGELTTLRDTGCLFVVTAVESIDDAVLSRLDKGHTRADVEAVVDRCRQIGLTLAPTFIPFTPWTTLAGYHELLRTIDALDLVEQVAPIQLTLRLLIQRGSRLLELEEQHLGVTLDPFDARRLVYPWRHPDSRVDRLQEMVTEVVGRRLTASRSAVFDELLALASERVGAPVAPRPAGARDRATVAYLNEPWYC